MLPPTDSDAPSRVRSLLQRCRHGATFSSAALTFEDERGPAGYVDFLMEGCEAAELPGEATVDATAIVCGAAFAPIVFLVVSDGTVAQSVSAAPPPGGSFDQAAVLAQALALIEALPPPQ